MRSIVISLLAMLFAVAHQGQASAAEGNSPIGRTIAPFTLQDHRGKAWQLDDFADRKLVVVAFLGTECPLAKLYGPRLEQLAKAYESKQVAVIGINANSQDSITELAAYARVHQIGFPLLKDPGNRVADAFDARRTPEVFVLDAGRKVVYHGRIDDQYGVGYTRDEPQRSDLRIALDELLAGKPVSQPETPLAGCYIGRARQPRGDSEITYSNQIARIFQKRCVECHRPGDIAPFALLNYEEVAGWAETIAEVVREDRMPPWHADPKHGTFAGDRRLTSEEKSQIAAWVKAGAPQGDLRELPPEPKFATAEWQLPREPDMVIAMRDKPYVVKAEGTIGYQFFTVDVGNTEDKWISAVEVRPGNRAVVHHALVFAGGGKDGQIDRDGVRGFFAAYVPGMRAAVYPDGMARKLPVGAKLVFQMHYTPNGSEQLDLTEVGLIFADPKSIQYEVRNTSAVERKIEIPPGDDNYRLDATSPSTSSEARLLAMMPHMHLRGKSFFYEAVYPDGKRETLLNVPRYDFNWQTRYCLAEPRTLPAGTRIHAVAHFDNSEYNLSNPDPTKTVRWGSQTWEEMMIGYVDVALPVDRNDAKNVAVASQDRAARVARVKQFVERLDSNADGTLTRSEVPELLRPAFDRISGGKDSVDVKRVREVLERRSDF